MARKIRTVVKVSLLVVFALLYAGCTNTVRPTVSQSEFLNNAPKVNSTVALHLTDDFRYYEGKHVDWWCDGTTYTMEIGPLASDWFQYSLESRFKEVKVMSGLPRFPYSSPGVDIVVTPKFTSFKAGGPLVVKFENYWVELGMSATIQDRAGKVLDVLELTQKGAKGGTGGINPGVQVYPEVCRNAVGPLVNQTVGRVASISKRRSTDIATIRRQKRSNM